MIYLAPGKNAVEGSVELGAATGIPNLPEADAVRAELDAVLTSEIFLRAPSLAQFLQYVCTKVLKGEAEQIKEYNIAVEAFGRQPDFDQKEDAIVRVEAHRLRKRLKQYYETDGANHAIRIVIPPGQYVPVFASRPPDAGPSNGSDAVTAIDAVPVRQEVIELPVPGRPGHLPALPAPSRLRHWPFALAVIGLVLVAGVLLMLITARMRSSGTPPAGALAGRGSGDRAAAMSGAEDEGIRIACGLTAPKYIDSIGNIWLGDRYFLGGQVLTSPPETILRSRDPGLFQNRRQGDFRYDIPLDAGVYDLQLLFAERVFGTGNIAGGGESSRLFHVFVNGTPVIENLDIVSDAEGSNTADVKVFKDVRPAADGFLHLRFSPFKETAFVNGIAILPSAPGKMRPVRILAGPNSIRDSAGRLWSGDLYSAGGQVVTRSSSTVSGARYPELFRSERYGHFSYAIPVAPGRYTVTLYAAETWFGPSTPGGGGKGSRAFDVYCNGAVLLKSFDVYAAAGGENRAVEKSVRGLTPNAQGKLMLSFVPVVNYAIINAIEVTPEN